MTTGARTIVLVHGGWHGAWCWYRLVPLLERRGHHVLTPELPAHGLDTTPAGAVTLAAYAERVVATLRPLPEPAVLVGHSLGGMVITQAAELAPDKVAMLAYLSAFLPGDGESLAGLAAGDAESLLPAQCTVDATGTLLDLAPEGLRPALYADCRDEDVALARRLLRPEPLAPLSDPVRTTAGRFGRVPRAYIECRQDRALPLARQRAMQAARPCDHVAALDAGHSPFFSVPEALAECLAALPAAARAA